MNFITTWQQLPDGIQETSQLISDLDQCFLPGFANLHHQHEETLASLQRVFTGTPLAQPLADSCAAIQRNEFIDQHFVAIAAARAALQGAQFDCLQQQVRAALARPPIKEIQESTLPQLPATEAPSHVQVYMESTRQWLMELALAGFARLDAATLTPFMATLQQIQGEPQLVRQAALLTGFFNELMKAVPIAALREDQSQLPSYRWLDLWTRAMISASQPSPHPPAPSPNTRRGGVKSVPGGVKSVPGGVKSVPGGVKKVPPLVLGGVRGGLVPVSGTLRLLGMDLHQHDHFVSLVGYGVLENKETSRTPSAELVRITMSSYKVDAIGGRETWLLFPKAAPLLDALAQNRTLQISDMPYLATGDLIWQGQAKLGSKYDPIKTAKQWFAPTAKETPAPSVISPIDRHPVQLAEPIFLSDYVVKKQNGTLSLTWDNLSLPIATERISRLCELTDYLLMQSSQLFGLLRFDAGQWSVQPLSILTRNTKGKLETVSVGATASAILKKPPRSSKVAILQERASRLLRA